MKKLIDPHDRTELTGPWAGFGFQAGHMWTPENYTLYPEDMRWWSLTCNIAREWRLLMEQVQRGEAQVIQGGSNVTRLRDHIRPDMPMPRRRAG